MGAVLDDGLGDLPALLGGAAGDGEGVTCSDTPGRFLGGRKGRRLILWCRGWIGSGELDELAFAPAGADGLPPWPETNAPGESIGSIVFG